MGLLDLLGTPKNYVGGRLTDKELTHLETYKEQYKENNQEKPSTAKILRIALMAYLEQNLPTQKAKK